MQKFNISPNFKTLKVAIDTNIVLGWAKLIGDRTLKEFSESEEAQNLPKEIKLFLGYILNEELRFYLPPKVQSEIFVLAHYDGTSEDRLYKKELAETTVKFLKKNEGYFQKIYLKKNLNKPFFQASKKLADSYLKNGKKHGDLPPCYWDLIIVAQNALLGLHTYTYDKHILLPRNAKKYSWAQSIMEINNQVFGQSFQTLTKKDLHIYVKAQHLQSEQLNMLLGIQEYNNSTQSEMAE